MNEKEIDALINLLDDPDDEIYSIVRDRIVAIGEHIIPRLENVWEVNSFGHLFQNRIENIIHKIQFDAVYSSLKIWAQNGANSLLEGSLLVARYQYPDMNEIEVRNEILKIRQDIWLELNDNLTALEKVKVFNHVLFDIYGFRGNKKNYHAPQNSYLNNVVESKKGNPLSLAIIYAILAESLDVPIYGVNLPNHFILAYVDQYNILRLLEEREKGKTEIPENNVLFYINPFSLGTILHKSEVSSFIKHLKLDLLPEFFNPCNNLTIIVRLLNNLIFSYEKLGYPDKAEEIKILLQALTSVVPRELSE